MGAGRYRLEHRAALTNLADENSEGVANDGVGVVRQLQHTVHDAGEDLLDDKLEGGSHDATDERLNAAYKPQAGRITGRPIVGRKFLPPYRTCVI